MRSAWYRLAEGSVDRRRSIVGWLGVNLVLLGLALFVHSDAERGLLRSSPPSEDRPSSQARVGASRGDIADSDHLPPSSAQVGAAHGAVSTAASPAPRVFAALVVEGGVFALKSRDNPDDDGQASATPARTEQLVLEQGLVLTIASKARAIDKAPPRNDNIWTLVTPAGSCLVEQADAVTLRLHQGAPRDDDLLPSEGRASEEALVELDGARLLGCDPLRRFGPDAAERALVLSGAHPTAAYEALHRGSLGSVFTLGDVTILRQGPLPCAEEDNSVILTFDRRTPLATHRGFIADAWVNLPGRELLVLESTSGDDAIRVLEIVGSRVRQLGESPRSPLWADSAVC